MNIKSIKLIKNSNELDSLLLGINIDKKLKARVINLPIHIKQPFIERVLQLKKESDAMLKELIATFKNKPFVFSTIPSSNEFLKQVSRIFNLDFEKLTLSLSTLPKVVNTILSTNNKFFAIEISNIQEMAEEKFMHFANEIEKNMGSLLSHNVRIIFEPPMLPKLPKNKTVSENIEEMLNDKELIKILDKTPAPTIRKIDETIEQIKMSNPADPMLKYLEELRDEALDMEKMIKTDDKDAIQKAIDSILDRFQKGTITKKQMEMALREFAKNKKNSMKIVISKNQWEQMRK